MSDRTNAEVKKRSGKGISKADPSSTPTPSTSASKKTKKGKNEDVAASEETNVPK